MTGLVWLLSIALAGAVGSAVFLEVRRRRLTHRLRGAAGYIADVVDDADLAEWCRHMMLTVITHTGFEYSISLADLRKAPQGYNRTWNVPVSITVWSRHDDNAPSREATDV